MRVAFVGNVANSHFRIVSALRDERDLDAHLFVSSSSDALSRPENEAPDLAGSLPGWIHDGDWITPASVVAPFWSALARELASFDAVVASGYGPIYAQFAGRPWCFFVTGADLTVKPFPIAFRHRYPDLPHRVGEVVGGVWQRRAARRADQLWLQPFAPMVDAADRLGVDPSRRLARYLPIVVDTDVFRPDAPTTAETAALQRQLRGDADFVVFHPSRLVTDDSELNRRSGQWKGNDELIRGFARFVASGSATAPVLALVDNAGTAEREKAVALAAELGIESAVRWLRPPDGRSFSRAQMVALYQAADVGSDEFGVGWFGQVALETLASARALVTYVDSSVMRQLYPDDPIRSVRTAVEIADELERLYVDPGWRTEVGEAGRAWVQRYHSPEAATGVYADTIAELVAGGVIRSRTGVARRARRATS